MSDFEDRDDNRIYNFLSKILKLIRKLELEDLIFIFFSTYVIIITSWHICECMDNYYMLIIDIFIIISSVYINIYYFLTKIDRNDSKFVSTLIKKNFLIKKGRKKYINWEAVSSIGTFTAILMTSITGLISIELSSRTLKISEEMRSISEEATRLERHKSFNDIILKGSILFNDEYIRESEITITNFHSYFCGFMDVPDDVLFKIATINFLEVNTEDDDLKFKFGFDDNLVHVVKFFLKRHQYILKYEKYYNVQAILQDYAKRIDFYGRLLHAANLSKEDTATILDYYVSKDIICILSKFNYLNPYAREQYFYEICRDHHEPSHSNELFLWKKKLEILENMGNKDNPEYVLLKNMMEYRTRHQNPIGDDENVKEDMDEK